MAPGESTIRRDVVRLDRLTSLRFVAAAAVVLTHIATLYSNAEFRNIAFRGAYGVGFFFILSGFVLTWSHHPGDKPWTFWRRRFARIYPTHILTWGIAVYIIYKVFHATQTTTMNVASALLVQSWFNNSKVYFASDGVSWSLSDEAFFYLLFPLLFVILIRANRPTRWAVVVLSLAVSAIAPLALHIWTTGTATWIIFYFPATRLFEFLIGVVLALEYRDGWRPRIPWIVMAVVFAAGLTLGYETPSPQWRVYPMVIPMALLICWAVSKDLTGKKGVLNHFIFVRLGVWSFSLYLVHSLVIYLVEDKLFHIIPFAPLTSHGHGIPLGIDIALVAIVAAGFIHEAWERPLEKLLRGQPGRTELAAESAGVSLG